MGAFIPQATRGLRPVRPGVASIQGRWPCAGHRPARLIKKNQYKSNSPIINPIEKISILES